MDKKMKSFNKFVNARSVRYGTNAAILTVLVIGIIFVINIFVNQFVTAKWDISADKLYSISRETKDILKDVNMKIDIYGFYDEGKEPKWISELLEQYKKESKNITVQYVDPDKNPGLAQKLDPDKKGLEKGSILVSSDKKRKKIAEFDLYDYDMENQTTRGLKSESAITSAIQYVMSDKTPTIYFIKGHGEEELTAGGYLKSTLEGANFTVKSASLMEFSKIPEDADSIIFLSPKNDLSRDDQLKTKEYLDRGGKAFFLFDVNNTNPAMPQFGELLKIYNLALNNDVVVEDDDRHYLPKNPVFILPEVSTHDITGKITSGDLDVFLPASRSITIAKNKKEGIKETSLLQSTEKAWGETNLSDMKKDSSDLPGPLDLMVAVVKEESIETKQSKIVVLGDADLINESKVGVIPGNTELFMGSINWLQDIKQVNTVRTKVFSNPVLRMSQSEVLVIAALVLFLLPLLILGAGTWVWLRRRHL